MKLWPIESPIVGLRMKGNGEEPVVSRDFAVYLEYTANLMFLPIYIYTHICKEGFSSHRLAKVLLS